MAINRSYAIDDIGNHPLLPDNHEARLVQFVIELECEDASKRCRKAMKSIKKYGKANHKQFNRVKRVWTGIGSMWDDYKKFHKLIKKLKINSDSFTLWLPEFLYENNSLHINITNGRELKYKQIRRYSQIETKAYGFWDLYNGRNLVLPCDRLNGPFFANNTQLFQCHTLLQMIRREQDNCMNH